MLPALREGWGNPSSGHRRGRLAREMVEAARAEVAACLGVLPEEVVFTSGGSESDNWALAGVVDARGGGHVVTSAVEHPAVLATARALERAGRIRLTVVGVDRSGRADPDEIAARPRPRHRPRLAHAREQRGRHPAAGRRGGRGVPPPRRARAHRRGAGRGQGPGGRRRPGRGPAHRRRAQAVRAQGRRRPRRAPGGRDRADDPRRGPRARPARRHRERARDRRPRAPRASWFGGTSRTRRLASPRCAMRSRRAWPRVSPASLITATACCASRTPRAWRSPASTPTRSSPRSRRRSRRRRARRATPARCTPPPCSPRWAWTRRPRWPRCASRSAGSRPRADVETGARLVLAAARALKRP